MKSSGMTDLYKQPPSPVARRGGVHLTRKETTMTAIEINGTEIQIDRSNGQGHCWRAADEIDCPPSIQEEIAAEIIDGGQESCDGYRATNGQIYRW